MLRIPSFILLAATLASRAGIITGVVNAEGRPELAQGGAAGRYDSRKFKFVEKINYAELRDFVVYIEGPVAGVTNRFPQTRTVLTQRDAMFKPHVLPVFVGTRVEWPNEDDIYHNVFSMSEPKPFDLGLYKKDDASKLVTFDQPGRVDVFCSIHSPMHCIVLVIENPFFSVTDNMGRYTINRVPAGTYKLKAWHERLPPLSKEVVVPDSGEVKAEFTLGIKNLPKY